MCGPYLPAAEVHQVAAVGCPVRMQQAHGVQQLLGSFQRAQPPLVAWQRVGVVHGWRNCCQPAR
eukprot:226086-Chlamydomonas_euryale.AAC.1